MKRLAAQGFMLGKKLHALAVNRGEADSLPAGAVPPPQYMYSHLTAKAYGDSPIGAEASPSGALRLWGIRLHDVC